MSSELSRRPRASVTSSTARSGSPAPACFAATRPPQVVSTVCLKYRAAANWCNGFIEAFFSRNPRIRAVFLRYLALGAAQRLTRQVLAQFGLVERLDQGGGHGRPGRLALVRRGAASPAAHAGGVGGRQRARARAGRTRTSRDTPAGNWRVAPGLGQYTAGGHCGRAVVVELQVARCVLMAPLQGALNEPDGRKVQRSLGMTRSSRQP